MSNELERLKTELLAAEAEIARLESGFEELRDSTDGFENMPFGEDYSSGYETAMYIINFEVKRITGVKNDN